MLAWIYHYLPFYTMSRQLFLHHYLPAHLCSALVAGAVFDFVALPDTINFPVSVPGRGLTRRRVKKDAVVERKVWIAAGVIVGAVVAMFVFFAPLTYGTPGLDPAGVNRRRLLGAWTLVSSSSPRFGLLLISFCL